MSLPPFAPENLGAAVRVALPKMQAADESMMFDHFIIDRVTGIVIDDEGREVNTYAPVYDGIGLRDTFQPHEQSPGVGESTATTQRVNWHIPAPERIAALLTAGRVALWDGPVQSGDRVRLMVDGVAVKTARIAGEHDITHAVSQRFSVDDITGGEFA